MDIRIQHAITAHKKSDLKLAESLYREILKDKPTHPDANHNLGLLLTTLNKPAEALSLFKTATQNNSIIEQYWISYINFLIQQKNFVDGEIISKKALEFHPKSSSIHLKFGGILYTVSRFDEALVKFKKAIELKPEFVEAYFNLGNTFLKLNRLEDAEINFKKTTKLKPNFIEAHNNLGNTLFELNKFDEAEKSYRKTIELKPDYAEAYNNLGNTLRKLRRLVEAEINHKKAIELKPNFPKAHHDLAVLLKQNQLLDLIERIKLIEENEKNFENKNNINLNTSTRLSSNPFISNRKVEAELLTDLYKTNTKKLDDVDPGYLRYGNGRSSDYELFKNNSSIIKIVEEELTKIMKEAVNSDIFIMESFFNIFQTGSGIVSHNHINKFDEIKGLIDQKFSLTYYLDVGDQNCDEPGNLKLYNPDEEILLSDGKIAIIPASRIHSAAYGGKTDRVMIGVNFYSLI